MGAQMAHYSKRAHAFVIAAALLSATAAFAQERVGVALDVWAEGSSLTGEQWINTSRIDESFTYGALGGAANLFMLWRIDERLRFGPNLRLFGNYGASGDRGFILGFLSEASAAVEYALPAYEQFEALFGARAGLAVLFPGGAFAEEISRLQAEGVGIWNVPRPGWLVGLSVGARRPIGGNVSLRADLHAQYEQLFLFATDQLVDGLRFRKSWRTDGLRGGFLLGAEIAL
jgi:hypothetical protein